MFGRLKVLSVFIAYFLSGCIFPAETTYFEPSAEGAHITIAGCGGGPPEMATFNLDPSQPIDPGWRVRRPGNDYHPKFQVYAYRGYSQVEKPDQVDPNAVRLVFYAMDPDDPNDSDDPVAWGINLFDAISVIHPTTGATLPTNRMDPSQLSAGYARLKRTLFAVDIGTLTSFVVVVPRIEYHSIVRPEVRISFSEKTGVFFYAINC